MPARPIRRVATIIVAVSLVAVVPAHAETVCRPEVNPKGGEWRMMGNDYGHARHQGGERTISRLEAARLMPVWTFSANEATQGFFHEITGYPVQADGCIFVGSSTGREKPGWIFALNADGGDVSWKTQLSHGVYGTLAVADGVVYAFVSRVGSPYLAALDERTGELLWTTTVDLQPGSDAVSSPIVHDGMVWVGVSGTAAEGDDSTRFDFRGSSVVVEAGSSCADHAFAEPSLGVTLRTTCRAPGGTAGRILAHAYTIPDEAWKDGDGDAGGSIWSTISIDTRAGSPTNGYGFVGTGNPFNYESEHAHTNAVIKIDMRRTLNGLPNPALGEIAGSYKGDVEEYYPALSENTSCDENDIEGFFLAGFECGRLDLDFGAAPNIFRDRTGRVVVGAGQKSGVYHVFDPVSMAPLWKQIIGVPSAVGGIVGTAAFDGTSLYVPHSIAGYIASLDRGNGQPNWVSPTADLVHWGNPVTSANGVIYTVDLKGFLDAFDAGTGAPLVHRPMSLGANTGVAPTLTWGGVTVARNTIYASVGVGLTSALAQGPSMPDGFVIAYRPARLH